MVFFLFLFLHVELSMGLVRDCLVCIVYGRDSFFLSIVVVFVVDDRHRTMWDNKQEKAAFRVGRIKNCIRDKLGHHCIHLANWKDKFLHSTPEIIQWERLAISSLLLFHSHLFFFSRFLLRFSLVPSFIYYFLMISIKKKSEAIISDMPWKCWLFNWTFQSNQMSNM